MPEIRRVAVLGCGLMGSGIAEIAAKTGYDVHVREPNDDLVQKGKARIEKSLDRAVDVDRPRGTGRFRCRRCRDADCSRCAPPSPGAPSADPPQPTVATTPMRRAPRSPRDQRIDTFPRADTASRARSR